MASVRGDAPQRFLTPKISLILSESLAGEGKDVHILNDAEEEWPPFIRLQPHPTRFIHTPQHPAEGGERGHGSVYAAGVDTPAVAYRVNVWQRDTRQELARREQKKATAFPGLAE